MTDNAATTISTESAAVTQQPSVESSATLYSHSCLRCGYTWDSKNESPKCCSRCKSYLWNKPYVRDERYRQGGGVRAGRGRAKSKRS